MLDFNVHLQKLLKSSVFSRSKKSKFLISGALFCLILVILYANVFSGGNHKSHDKTLPVVSTAVVNSSDVPVYLSALGSVVPTSSVTVRTQVNGQLMRVLFQEGQQVKKGDLLAEIDPRPFQAQLTQYQGQLARDTALLNNANLDLLRYKKLFKQDSIAKQTLDTQESLVKQYSGNVKTDQGQIENTELNLHYCEITAPIDGRVGLRLVDAGNFVQTSSQNGLVVINTLNPITTTFSIPEDNLQDVIRQINAGNTLVAEAYDRAQNQLLATGKLLSIDNQIDPSTGTIKLKAQFANENNLLFPNQFVNIKLLVKTQHNAIVIPTAAVQYGATGTFVYLVTENNNPKKNKFATTGETNKAVLFISQAYGKIISLKNKWLAKKQREMRKVYVTNIKPIVSSFNYKDNTVVTSGVNIGDVVVVEGADKLTDGAKVSY